MSQQSQGMAVNSSSLNQLRVNKSNDLFRSFQDGMPHLKREERDLYEQACHREGKIWKKSNNILVGFQKRYFKVIAQGSYLAYYVKKPSVKIQDQKPKGVFEISKMQNIKKTQPKYFTFEYLERTFEMFTKTREEAEIWITCLQFLSDIKNKEYESSTTTRSTSYFHTLINTNQLTNQAAKDQDPNTEGKRDSGEQKEKSKRRSKSRGKFHKFQNIDAKAFTSVISENPQLVIDKDKQSLSEKALQTKGIFNYLKTVKKKTLRSRIMYGFLKKRSKGKVKYFKQRWFFLISSRPLNQEDFLNDTEILSDSVLPPMIEFDVIYYFIMETGDDASGPVGEIKTLNILKLDVKNMSKSRREEGHAFIIDTGKKIFHLNTEHRFELERWVEAIEISMQTARDKQLSITGAVKNISMIVSMYDTNEDILRQQIEDQYETKIPKNKEDWEDVESLLQVCTELRDDMITTFDACLALKPQRKDIIELYMKVAHTHMSDVLQKFWELQGVEMNPYETLSLVDWTYRYFKELKRFGVSDDSVENGYLTLCNAFAKKTHSQIMPMVINILKTEKEQIQIEEDKSGYLFTNAPYDLIKIFNESFQIVSVKRVKELILKTLRMFQAIMQQYQRALSKILNDPKIQHDFMIAQCNNCFIFFELMEDLMNPIRDICSDDEIESHYSQRVIQQYFSNMQSVLLNQMTSTIFKLRLEQLYLKTPFLDLDMELILNESFKFFEDYASKMSKSTSRQAWGSFLERTVLCYIQCMLNSSNKIRQKSSEQAIAKITEDYEKIENRFSEFMTQRSMKSGIEVLDDLVSFFQSSPAFISVACEKLRKTQGPTFKLSTVKALLNLRTDLSKEERQMALKVCEEILDSFKHTNYDAQNTKRGGIFSNIDITQAAQISKEIDGADGGDHGTGNQDEDSQNGIDTTFDIDDFLKQGGIDVDQIDGDEVCGKNKQNTNRSSESDKNIYNTDPDKNMSGWLQKSSFKFKDNESQDDLLGMVFGSIGSIGKLGLKVFTETIQIKTKKKYFALKNDVLYWYSHERAREAVNQVNLKETKAIEINKNNAKEFFIVCKKKCYRFECQHDQEALKWVNSLKQAVEQDAEYLDLNRYEKLKIYNRITGKSMYKDYDELLEIYESKVHEVIERKLQEYLQKKKKWQNVESTINKQVDKVKKDVSKKQAKKQNSDLQENDNVNNAIKTDDENFVKSLPETQELMTKLNPQSIDLFSAAFGDEETQHAQAICRKIMRRAFNKALQRSFHGDTQIEGRNFKSESQVSTGSGDNNLKLSFVENNRVTMNSSSIMENDMGRESATIPETQDESDSSDWGLDESQYSPPHLRAKKGQQQSIVKDPGMAGMSLRRLDMDPEELIQRSNRYDELDGSRPSGGCFACFSIRSRKQK